MKLSVAIAGAEALPSAFVVFRGLEKSIVRAAELGYDGVELALMRPDEIGKSDLRTLLERNRMEVSAVSSGQVFAARGLSFTDEDTERRKELDKTFKGFIDLAADFGRLVNIGRVRGSLKGRDKAFCEQLFFDMAGELCVYAARKGVELILEPVNRYEIDFINNCDEGAALLDKAGIPNLTMMPDVFHMNIEDDRIGDSLRRNARYVRYIHLADSNRHAPGDGHLDFTDVFNALDDIGYNGWATVEILPYPEPDIAAQRAVSYLRKFICA
ncbi:MAG: sugar phosphate isomerase/epimerase family protein [Sphaerochaetaceae bacterium]|nr:sugar phosphate isomerase/epimerase family protein [Sphaerochaetaceae bacterium]